MTRKHKYRESHIGDRVDKSQVLSKVGNRIKDSKKAGSPKR